MKKAYLSPTINCCKLDVQDVITSSCLWNGQDYPNGGSPIDGGTNANEQIGSNWWDEP